MKILASAVLLLQVASQQPYIETFEVRLHNLDVVVTDAAGKPVEGLTKDDFVVLEDGVRQEVSNFSVEDRRSRLSGQAGLPVPHPRKFVFFFDEMSLHPASRAKLLKNAVTLLHDTMREGDLAAVVRPVGKDNILQEFTGDRAAVEKAMKAALDESRTRIDTQIAEELRFLQLQLADSATKQERQFARKMYADKVRRRVEQRLGHLRALVGSLSSSEGKKVLVFVTATLQAQPGREALDFEDIDENALSGTLEIYPDLGPQIADLARTAAAVGVTIYALQPDVPISFATPGLDAPRRPLRTLAAAPVQAPTPRRVLPSDLFSKILDNTESTVTSLAEKTGGRWYRGDGNIDNVFQQVASDLRTYYSLAYHAKGASDRVRRVEVRVKDRPELRVRTRTEVIEKSPSSEMRDLTVASLLYPRTVNELNISAVPKLLKKDRDLFTVSVDTLIPMKNLTFLPSGDDKYRASFTVHYAASGETADFVAGAERRQDVEITAEELYQIEEKMYHYTSDLVVAPGRIRIAVGVLDATSKLSGFRTLEVYAR